MTTAPLLGAIVLAGGRGDRLGGVDKAALELRGERLVERAVAAASEIGAHPVVVVGPGSAAVHGALTVREDPPLAGPLAALDAGLAALGALETRGNPPAKWLLLLACDLVDPVAVCAALAEALPPRGDGVLLSDPDGRAQWLAGVYRVDTVTAGLAAARAEAARGSLANLPVRLAFSRADLAMIAAPAATIADIDTPHDLEQARAVTEKE